MWVPRELDLIATRLQQGQRVRRITVRRLLQMFDSERRSPQKVQEIKSVLDNLRLETEPDFEQEYIDAMIKIRQRDGNESEPGNGTPAALDDSVDNDAVEDAAQADMEEQVSHDSQFAGPEPGEEVDEQAPEDIDDESGQPIVEPFDPAKIRIESKQLSLDTLIARMKNKEIVLRPEFQRKEVWKPKAQSRLIESLLVRIPIPAFYMDATDDEKWLVVDGQQRLSTLRRFVIDKTLRLSDLEFLTKQLDGDGFERLPRYLQRRIMETNVTVYLIEKGTPVNVKFNVFQRINTGGLPLSPQEIRHALNGPNVNHLLRLLAESREFLQATRRAVKPLRMVDREYVVRFFAFLLHAPENYNQRVDFDVFLSSTMREINDMTDEEREALAQRFLHAMRISERVLGKFAFRKRDSADKNEHLKPLNKALFEAWSVNLEPLGDQEVECLEERENTMWLKFADLMADRGFRESITQGTADPNKVKLRFSKIRELLQETLA